MQIEQSSAGSTQYVNPKSGSFNPQSKIRNSKSFRWSVTGIGSIFIILLIITGFLSIVLANNYLVVLFSTMLAFFIVSAFLTLFSLRALTVTRTLPDHAFAGEDMDYTIILRNNRRWFPELMLTLRDRYLQEGSVIPHTGPPVFLPLLRPRHTSRMIFRIRPPRRGMLTFHSLSLSAEIPPGVLRLTRTMAVEDRLLIYPRRAVWAGSLAPLIGNPEETLSYQPSAFAHGYTEWGGLREYHPGDNPRHIYWKSYGRLNDRLLLKEFESNRERKATLLLDPYVPHSGDQKFLVRLDTAISFGMALAEQLIRDGYTVTFVTRIRPENTGVDHLILNAERLNQFELYETLAHIQPLTRSLLPEVLEDLRGLPTPSVLFVLSMNGSERDADTCLGNRKTPVVHLDPAVMRSMIRFPS